MRRPLPDKRTAADRRFDALQFVMCARPAAVDAMTAAALAERYDVPVAYAAELLDQRRQQGLGL